MNRKGDLKDNPNLEPNPDKGKEYSLVLHNDDIHDFEYVINSLIDICNHDSIQAEQCTYLVHYHGECHVKKGTYKKLKSMYDLFILKGLKVTLN